MLFKVGDRENVEARDDRLFEVVEERYEGRSAKVILLLLDLCPIVGRIFAFVSFLSRLLQKPKLQRFALRHWQQIKISTISPITEQITIAAICMAGSVFSASMMGKSSPIVLFRQERYEDMRRAEGRGSLILTGEVVLSGG